VSTLTTSTAGGLAGPMELVGIKDVIAALEEMSIASRRRVMRPAIREGASIVSKAAKKNAKSRTNVLTSRAKKAQGPGPLSLGAGESTGALSRSIGIKTGIGKHGVFAVIGARVRQGDTLVRVGARSVRTRRPSRYSHLVEKGTSHSRAFPFLGPAFEQNRGRIKAAILRRARKEFVKEANKIAAKAAKRAGRAA